MFTTRKRSPTHIRKKNPEPHIVKNTSISLRANTLGTRFGFIDIIEYFRNVNCFSPMNDILIAGRRLIFPPPHLSSIPRTNTRLVPVPGYNNEMTKRKKLFQLLKALSNRNGDEKLNLLSYQSFREVTREMFNLFCFFFFPFQFFFFWPSSPLPSPVNDDHRVVFFIQSGAFCLVLLYNKLTFEIIDWSTIVSVAFFPFFFYFFNGKNSQRRL